MQISHKKNLCWSLFLIKLQAFKPALVLKKRLQHKCFPVNIVKFLRTLILKYIFERLLLYSEIQTTNNVIYILAQNFIFNFRILAAQLSKLWLQWICACYCIFLTYYFEHLSQHFQSSSLNRLNTFSHYQKFVLISNAQNLSSGFI